MNSGETMANAYEWPVLKSTPACKLKGRKKKVPQKDPFSVSANFEPDNLDSRDDVWLLVLECLIILY